MLLKSRVEVLFNLNLSISKLDMLVAITRFSNFQNPSCFPYFSLSSSEIILHNSIDPLNSNLTEEQNVIGYFMNDLTKIQLLYGTIGVGKTTYGLGLQRLLIVAYLGTRIPSTYAAVPIFDVIACSVSLNHVKEQNLSSFQSELLRMENLLVLAKQSANSLFFVDNYGESTSSKDAYV